MNSQTLKNRLEELNAEAESGKKMLANLDAQRAELQQTLLRISGAIQVLEELMAAEQNGVAPEKA